MQKYADEVITKHFGHDDWVYSAYSRDHIYIDSNKPYGSYWQIYLPSSASSFPLHFRERLSNHAKSILLGPLDDLDISEWITYVIKKRPDWLKKSLKQLRTGATGSDEPPTQNAE